MNEFQRELQTLQVGDFGASATMPLDYNNHFIQGQVPAADPSRLCFGFGGFCFGFGGFCSGFGHCGGFCSCGGFQRCGGFCNCGGFERCGGFHRCGGW